MKISSSDITMAASHSATQVQSVNESLRAWVGNGRPDFEQQASAASSGAPENSASKVQISELARVAASDDAKAQPVIAGPVRAGEAQAIEDAGNTAKNDPMLWLIKQILEHLLGHKINLYAGGDLGHVPAAETPAQGSADNSDPPPEKTEKRAGWGMEYDQHTSYTETEQASFHASGVIRTADNQEISFDVSVNLQRSYSEESNTHVRLGDAKKVDPLVINFSGDAAALSSQKFAFDLDADGKQENISFIQGGGFLALDRNRDGKINDGHELFGPAAGNGFNELQALDGDGNGWIDENDAAFQDLSIWTKDASGADQLTSLKDAGVGALYLGNASTPFEFKDAQNKSQGQLRSSGVWLTEDGQARSMQQIDLTV
ncbi:MAG: VCBS repeat-containing protein [Pseudomonadota bacterium]